MKLIPKKQYRFDWFDTYSFTGWDSDDDIDDKTVRDIFQQTLGFFVKEDSVWYIVAKHFNPNSGFKQWGDITYIPKGCVKKIQCLN